MKKRDRFLLDLNEDLALRCDDLQLIISKRKKPRADGSPRFENLKFSTEGWNGEGLTEKAWRGVLRCLRQLAYREDLKLKTEISPAVVDFLARRRAGLCDRAEEVYG
ncbi:hypothetical protein DDZ18_08855 [Marinicauda salina]|uniref:Uncharacterized protein n=1 Tax=Marinicauda salina TaxID=2135793 RepID=A0A2U2BUR6_9PROT|nr:hypothetical protein [Marinicauda salina]PWE17753.1 hypothetical protein DDZ18_08855 [Marinicauda salina]